MATIFISYRRADGGWAHSLNQSLATDFDVFLDVTAIDYGAAFSKAILDELESCRIVLVVVGKEWIRAAAARLHQSDDWVRKEIEEALKRRPQIRIVPVFFDDVETIPVAVLPPELRDLAVLNGIMMRNDSFKRDVEALHKRLHEWLERESSETMQREPMVDLLPQLCDRSDQEEDLYELLAEGGLDTKTPVIIVHGHKWEEHTGFLDRLLYRGTLLEFLDRTSGTTPGPVREVGIKAYPSLEWSTGRAREGRYALVLQRALKRAVLGSLNAPDKDLLSYFQSLRQPTVLVLQVTWSDYQTCGKELFEGFISAWAALFRSTDGATPSGTAQPVLLWINFSYEESSQKLGFDTLLSEEVRKAGRDLRPMEPINRGQVQAWLQRDDVRGFVNAAVEARVTALFDDPGRSLGEGRMHMTRFVEGVRPLLSVRRS